MKKLSNKGFTLVELIIVIAILAIIMLIAIPNVPKIIQRNRVKTDMISAQKICEYVRAWHSDYSTDKNLKGSMTEIPVPVEGSVRPKNYKVIEGIGIYVAEDYTPTSLLNEDGVAEENQCFAVFFNGTKLVVAIVPFTVSDSTETIEALTLAENLAVNYDGTTGKNIAFIEGE